MTNGVLSTTKCLMIFERRKPPRVLLDSRALVRLLWYTGLLVAMLGAPVGLARLMDFMWTGHYNKLLIPGAMLIATLALCLRGSWLRIDCLGLLLLTLIPIGVSVGLWNSGEARYFISHLAAASFAFLLYAASRGTQLDEAWLERFWAKASDLLLASYTACVSFFWIIHAVTGTALYLGIGSSDLLFSLSYYLVYKRKWRTVLTLAVILLTGKRSSILALIVVMLFYLPLPGRHNFFLRTLLACAMAVMIILASFAAKPWVMALDLPFFMVGILDKWYLMDPFSGGFNLDLALSGRNQEITLSFQAFSAQAHTWMLGMGFGWSYFFDAVIEGSETTNFHAHYIHLSPANLVLLYGLPLAGLILLLMWGVISRGYHNASRGHGRPMLRVLVLFWIGAFTASLSGYSYPTDSLFWLSLGTLGSLTQAATAHHQTIATLVIRCASGASPRALLNL